MDGGIYLDASTIEHLKFLYKEAFTKLGPSHVEYRQFHGAIARLIFSEKELEGMVAIKNQRLEEKNENDREEIAE